MQTLRRTPLYERHAALGARLVPFAGWEMPVQYSSIRDEHLAVRRSAGVFDVSHMGQLELVRLAVPRRVYTSRQLEQAADAVAATLAEAGSVQGFELVEEAPVLRHFTARFQPLDGRLAGAGAPEPSRT